MISKRGLLNLLKDKSADVKGDALAWYRIARGAQWTCFEDVHSTIADADFVNGLLVFNIRQNRFRLIVFPVFKRQTLYIKALLSHKAYDRKDWVNKWP